VSDEWVRDRVQSRDEGGAIIGKSHAWRNIFRPNFYLDSDKSREHKTVFYYYSTYF
jgi:hypothetical protein